MLSLLLAVSLSVPSNIATRVLPVVGEDLGPIATATVLSKRYMLTNAHVVEDAKAVLVGCGTLLIAGRVVGVAPKDDLALLKLDFDCPLAQASPVALKNPELGVSHYVVGYPTRQFAVRHGVVAGYKESHGYRDTTEHVGLTDAAVWPGSSGGPVLNESGEIIGIVMAYISRPMEDGSRGVAHLGVFVTAESVHAFLKSMKYE